LGICLTGLVNDDDFVWKFIVLLVLDLVVLGFLAGLTGKVDEITKKE